MNPTILGFIKKEIIQTLREPRLRAILIVPPLLQLVLFGYAISTEVRNIRLAAYYEPLDRVAERLEDRLLASGWFVPARVKLADPYREVQDGYADAVMVAPPGGLKRALGRGGRGLQLLVDGTNTVRARGIDMYVQSVGATLMSGLNPGAAAAPALNLSVRVLYNPALETPVFMVPGVMCMLLALVTLILTSAAIVREKEMGTFETLISSPVEKWEIILGKTVPYIIIGALDAPLIIGVAVLLFHVPLRGPLWMLAAATVAYVCCMVAVGTLISTVAKRQQQSMMATFMFTFPALLLSGVFYPLDNMPGMIYWVTFLSPIRYYVTLLRNIMLKGGDMSVFLGNIGGLLALGAGLIWLSYVRFHQRLD